VRKHGERTENEESMYTSRQMAIVGLGVFSDARFDVYALAGSRYASTRASFLSELTGAKVPQSKAGVHALQDAFYDGIQGECLAKRQEAFCLYCERVCREMKDLPVAQELADKAQARREERERWDAHYGAMAVTA